MAENCVKVFGAVIGFKNPQTPLLAPPQENSNPNPLLVQETKQSNPNPASFLQDSGKAPAEAKSPPRKRARIGSSNLNLKEQEEQSRPVKLFGVLIKNNVVLDKDFRNSSRKRKRTSRKRQRTTAPAPAPEGLLRLQLQPHFDITKKLTMSDIESNARLLLHKQKVEDHILPYLSEEQRRDLDDEKDVEVVVRDVDKSLAHKMYFKNSLIGYIFKYKWRKNFVFPRKLKEGDEIGVSWDRNNSCLLFSVLQRANGTSED